MLLENWTCFIFRVKRERCIFLAFLNDIIGGLHSVFFILFDILWKQIHIKRVKNDYNKMFIKFLYNYKLTCLRAALKNKHLHLQFAYSSRMCKTDNGNKSDILKYATDSCRDFMQILISWFNFNLQNILTKYTDPVLQSE